MSVLLRLLAALLVAATAAWGALALHFGFEGRDALALVLPGLLVVSALGAIIGMFVRSWRRRALSVYGALFAAVLAWWSTLEPSNDRHWQPDVAQLPSAEINGDFVTVHNIRNFDYRSETDFTPRYETKTYDLRKLDSVDLYAVYWMGPAIAHIMVSFGFGGEDYLAVSIEARKEEGEGYSSIKGFFRRYELVYVVADERDVIRLRTQVRNNPPEEVYRYRLQTEPEGARRFFLDYVKAINELHERPQFYNTLATNCTNVIWMHGRVNPNRVPFSWKILASGYVPEYLYEKGRLDTTLPFAELVERGHVNTRAREAGDGDDFSRQIRR